MLEQIASLMKKTGARILIIDDHRGYVQEIKDILRQEGFEVMICDNIDAGIAEAIDKKPDIVLLDIDMNGRGGFGFLEAIDDMPLKPEVMILTDKDDFGSLRQSFSMGARHYLLKSVPPAKLVLEANKLLHRSPKRNDHDYEEHVCFHMTNKALRNFIRNRRQKTGGEGGAKNAALC